MEFEVDHYGETLFCGIMTNRTGIKPNKPLVPRETRNYTNVLYFLQTSAAEGLCGPVFTR